METSRTGLSLLRSHSAYLSGSRLLCCSQLLQKEAYLIVTEQALIISVTGYQ